MQYGLGLAEFIDKLYYGEEATLAIVYGGYLGTGKSSYCIKGAAEVYGSHSGWADNVPNYEAVKPHLVFTPKEFVDKVLSQKRREKVIIWDDMGLWLFAMDWYDPFVKATVKYFNVMRTDYAMILGNTPSPKMIVKRIQMFPDSIRIKISKRDTDLKHPSKPRLAKAYKVWSSPDMKRTGVTMQGMWEDAFNAMMPDPFYKDWYEPRRTHYATLAKQLMLTELQKTKQKEALMGAEVLPEPGRVKELEEVIAQRL